jgi:5-methylcytosine-specific restriction endonuclease McrA
LQKKEWCIKGQLKASMGLIATDDSMEKPNCQLANERLDHSSKLTVENLHLTERLETSVITAQMTNNTDDLTQKIVQQLDKEQRDYLSKESQYDSVKTKNIKICESIKANNPLNKYFGGETCDINSLYALILLNDLSLDKLYKKVVKYGPDCDRFSKMVSILKNYAHRSPDKKTIPPMIRQAVWNKYIGKLTEGKCYCCGITEISAFNFEAGHVVAENCGGLITVENLRPICSSCNKSMNDEDMRKYVAIYYPESLILKEISSS